MNPAMWSIDSIYHRLRGTHHDYMETDGRIYADYLQPQGRTILDVGTGNGNSAKRFLEAGALKVLCIEKDAGLATQIRLPRTEVYQEPFDAEKHLLGLEWDACKIDIEGYEVLALPVLDRINKPIICEVHGAYLIERFHAGGGHGKGISIIIDCSSPSLAYVRVILASIVSNISAWRNRRVRKVSRSAVSHFKRSQERERTRAT